MNIIWLGMLSYDLERDGLTLNYLKKNLFVKLHIGLMIVSASNVVQLQIRRVDFPNTFEEF